MARTVAIFIGDKDGGEALADLLADLKEVHLVSGASGALHYHIISIIEVVALERFYNEVVDCVCVVCARML